MEHFSKYKLQTDDSEEEEEEEEGQQQQQQQQEREGGVPKRVKVSECGRVPLYSS